MMDLAIDGLGITELKNMDEKSLAFFLQHIRLSSLEAANQFVDDALFEIQENKQKKLKAIFSVNYSIFPDEAWRDEKFASKMIEQNEQFIAHVPAMFRTPSLTYQALMANPENLIYIEWLDFDIVLKATQRQLELEGKMTILDKDYIHSKVREEVKAFIEKEHLEMSLDKSQLTINKKLKI
jgi:hypothetical protein